MYSLSPSPWECDLAFLESHTQESVLSVQTRNHQGSFNQRLKMSSGGSTFSHLKYLHAGLQESAQRQIDEFNERVQVHFDWLANFKVEKEAEKAVPKTPATGKTKQLPQITPLKGFNYQPSTDRPALALIDTNSISSFETPRSKRLALRNAAKQMPAKPPAPSLRNGKEALQEIDSSADPVSDEILLTLDSHPLPKGRAKREFKRAAEKVPSSETAENIETNEMDITPVSALISSDAPLESHVEPMLTEEAPVIPSSTSVEVPTEQISEIEEKHAVTPEAVEQAPVEEEEKVNVDDLVVPNANTEVAEAMASRRQARRGGRAKAKKSEAVAPLDLESIPSTGASEPFSTDDIDFSALDEAIMEAFSPRGKSESNDPPRRRGRPARAKASAAEDPIVPPIPKRNTRATKAKATRATRATRKTENEATDDDATDTTTHDMTHQHEDACDDPMEVDFKANLKKRSRESSLAEPSHVEDLNEEDTAAKVESTQVEAEPSPKRRCTNEFKENRTSSASTPSSSETAQSSASSSSHTVDSKSEAEAIDESELEARIAFEKAEAAAYAAQSSPVASKSISSPSSELLMEVTPSVEVKEPAKAEEMVICEEPAPVVVAPASPVKEVKAVAVAPPSTKKSALEKRASEMIQTGVVPPSSTSHASRASTNTANPNSGKTAFAAINAAHASRLNEKIARIQENKAELEAKRRSELEAKQKLEKEKTTDRIRERLDMVRKRTATTTSTRNLVASASTSSSIPAKPTNTNNIVTSTSAPAVPTTETSSAKMEVCNESVNASTTTVPEQETKQSLDESKSTEVEFSATTVAELVKSPNRPKPVLAAPRLSFDVKVDKEVASTTSSLKASPPSTPKAEAKSNPIEMLPWPPAGVPEIRTPPSSPIRSAAAPPSLAEAATMSIKKSTPRRFLHGLMAKGSTPAKHHTPSQRTPASASRMMVTPGSAGSEGHMPTSSSKKGFWGSLNFLGLFGGSKKTVDGLAPSGLLSDSPLLAPTTGTAVARTESPLDKPDFAPTSLTSPIRVGTTKRIEASWSPLLPPPSARTEPSSAMAITTETSLDSSLDDSFEMKTAATVDLTQKTLEEYSAGIRSVPLLDSSESEDDEYDVKYYAESSSDASLEDFLARSTSEESFDIVSGSGSSLTTVNVKEPVSAQPMAGSGSSSSVSSSAATSASTKSSETQAAAKAPKTPEKNPLANNPFFNSPEVQIIVDTPKKRAQSLKDDDEDDDPTGALWTRPKFLLPVLEMQASMDPDEIFSADVPTTCDLTEIFSEVKVRLMARPRTSSGIWTRDKLTADEKREYKRRMGYTVQTLRKDERR